MDEQELGGWSELDPVKRAAHFIRLNDIVVQANVVIPLVPRNRVTAGSSQIRSVELSGWDSTFWRLPYWHREA
jgi:peptide/nickel transport system substrate-binding protein